jgi:PAS domain S-box-containing protein
MEIAGKEYLVGIYRDVTERKRGEEDLISSEQRFRAIFDNATDGILLTDVEEKRFFTANNRFCQMLGYTLDEVEQLEATDLHPEEGQPYISDVFEMHTQGEFIRGTEIPMQRKDGSCLYDDINTTSIEIAGKEYLVSIYRDVTDRKEAEDEIIRQSEFLTTVMESLTHPFYVIDAKDYTIKMANPATGFGRISADSTCYAITHKRDKPCDGVEHPCTLKKIMETGGPTTLEHTHYDKDGNPRIVEVHGFPIFDEDNNVVQIIEYNFDITDRKELEEEHLAAKDRIIEEMRRHEKYVFEVADRLRDPLQVQKGLLELLEPDDINPDHKEMFEKILNTNKDLEKWIKKLT